MAQQRGTAGRLLLLLLLREMVFQSFNLSLSLFHAGLGAWS